MKATINGTTVEGTVDEIIEYLRKVNVIKTTTSPNVYPKLPWSEPRDS